MLCKRTLNLHRPHARAAPTTPCALRTSHAFLPSLPLSLSLSRVLQYEPVYLANDICLVHLAGSLPATFATAPDGTIISQPYVLLNKNGSMEEPGTEATLCGWGVTGGVLLRRLPAGLRSHPHSRQGEQNAACACILACRPRHFPFRDLRLSGIIFP